MRRCNSVWMTLIGKNKTDIEKREEERKRESNIKREKSGGVRDLMRVLFYSSEIMCSSYIS